LRRLAGFVQAQFGRRCCRETIRRTLHRLKLSWQKARKLLGRAKPGQREAFIAGRRTR
jgi:transposase